MSLEVLNDAQSGVGYVGAIKRKGNVVWAVGGSWGSPIVMTSEGGRKFRRRKSPEASGLRDVLPLAESRALVVGEGGALFEGNLVTETWDRIATSTTACLFAIERAHGMIWIAGDDAFMLSSADGTAWRKPRAPAMKTMGRVQRLAFAHGALWLLSYTGKLAVMKDAAKEPKILAIESEKPLTGIAFSPRGIGVLVGDGGTIFRSTNRGTAWSEIETAIEEDIEDLVWHDGRFIAVGEDGLVIVSEDGETFARVDSGREEHLWAVASDGASVLIGGDGGLMLGATSVRTRGDALDRSCGRRR